MSGELNHPESPNAQTDCVTKFSPRTDHVAIAVFEQAQQAGESVTMALVHLGIAEVDEEAALLLPQQVYPACPRCYRRQRRPRGDRGDRGDLRR
jgi:hypothetical protein